MEATNPQDNIGQLIHRLKQLNTTYAGDHPDLVRISWDIVRHLEHFMDGISTIHESGYLKRIAELEEEVLYLKELNTSQRMMMEDIVKHLQELKTDGD